jgi:Xaa-Pro dipeptidase
MLLVCSRQNVGYVADYTYYVGQGLPTILEDGRQWSRAYAGLPADPSLGAFITVQHAEEHILAQADPWITDRRAWGPIFQYDAEGAPARQPGLGSQGVVEAVVSALNDRGLESGTIALELSALPADAYIRLREQLPRATFVDAGSILWELRIRKSGEEMRRLRRIAQISDAAIEAGYEALDAAQSEIATRQVMASAVAARGAEFGWTSVAYGPKGTLNIEPTARLPATGEIVRIDLVGSYRGYYSDMSRVGSLGRIESRDARRAHAAILATNARMRQEAGPGVRCSDLYRIAQESLGRRGYRTLAGGSGHGIGRDVGEPPYLTDWDHTVLAPGMVICVEPAIRVPGVGSVNIEDMVVITENGNETLTSFRRDLTSWPRTR